MTDRIRTLTITLDADYRDDDVQPIVAAIRQIRGVSDVVLGKPVDLNQHVARRVVRHEIYSKLHESLVRQFFGDAYYDNIFGKLPK